MKMRTRQKAGRKKLLVRGAAQFKLTGNEYQ